MKNYFERIKNAVNKFVAEYDKAKLAYDAEVKNVKANYLGAKFAEEMGKVQEAFNVLTAPMEQKALDEVNVIYAEMRQEIQDIVTKPCSSEAVELLGVLKLSANVSDEELKAYFTKYGKNYIAKKILHDIVIDKYGLDMNAAEAVGDNFITLDAMVEELEGVKAETIWTIKNYINNGNVYRAANFFSFAQLNRVEGIYSAFVNGYSTEG